MDLPTAIKRYYDRSVSQGDGCCGPVPTIQGLKVPSFGCGEPTVFAALAPGETVLDLGSGAGLDCFRAAEAVGPQGQVIGVDITPAMLRRARQGAAKLGLTNVEFREGLIERLPVEDASIDVVISNCVINLSTDKARVFADAYRVLKPGGRMRVSDMLRNGPRLTAVSEAGWCACEDGAEPPEVYRELLKAAGFIDIAIDPPGAEVLPGATYSARIAAQKPAIRPARAEDLEAVRTLLRDAGLPTAGLEKTTLYVLKHGGVLAGVAGFERYGALALLRSLAVAPGLRGHGYGRALLRFILNRVTAEGVATAYGLTTTIPDWLTRLGFGELTRAALPHALHASAELQGACPAEARVFALRLDS